MLTKQDLLARIDAHETEGAAIETAMTELGVTAKDMKALRKAQKAAEEARRTLNALMGIDPDAAAQVAPEANVEACADVADDTAAEPVVAAAEDAKAAKK